MIVGKYEITPQPSSWMVREIKGTREGKNGKPEITYGVARYCSTLERVAINIKEDKLKEVVAKSANIEEMVGHLGIALD